MVKTKAHAFNFEGGELLAKIGASWFSSYWNFNNRPQKDLHWERSKTARERIVRYNNTKHYHDNWRREVLKMNDSRLSRNKIGLTGAQVKNLIK